MLAFFVEYCEMADENESVNANNDNASHGKQQNLSQKSCIFQIKTRLVN